MGTMKSFRKACHWLNKQTKGNFLRSYENDRVCDIYKILRPGKKSVRFCVEYVEGSHVIRIKRICI